CRPVGTRRRRSGYAPPWFRRPVTPSGPLGRSPFENALAGAREGKRRVHHHGDPHGRTPDGRGLLPGVSHEEGMAPTGGHRTRYEEDVLLDRESPTLLGDEDRPHPAAVPAQEEVDGVERAAVGPFPDRLFDLSVELLQLVRLRDGDDERQVA